jgi:hypothetical protein
MAPWRRRFSCRWDAGLGENPASRRIGRSARRSSSATPTTSGCGRARVDSRMGGLHGFHHLAEAHFSPTPAASKSGRSPSCAKSRKRAFVSTITSMAPKCCSPRSSAWKSKPRSDRTSPCSSTSARPTPAMRPTPPNLSHSPPAGQGAARTGSTPTNPGPERAAIAFRNRPRLGLCRAARAIGTGTGGTRFRRLRDRRGFGRRAGARDVPRHRERGAISPENKPRYAMGLGTPPQILEMISRGVDMFDCVMPTRIARHGMAFTLDGPLHIKNLIHAKDPRPICESAHPARLRILPRLPPPPVPGGGNPRFAVAFLPQSAFLPAPRRRCAGVHRRGELPRIQTTPSSNATPDQKLHDTDPLPRNLPETPPQEADSSEARLS